jgi:hypothetical protein
MTSVFALLDVDVRQWKAVTRTLLRSDFRLPLTTDSSSLGRAGPLFAMALVLGLFGAGAAFVVFSSPDVLVTGTIVLAYLSVMLATTLLTQHGTTLLSTADFAILGARPVSSRTFFAIRITNVLFHALLITSLMAYPVVIAYAVAHRGGIVRAAASGASIYGWSVAVTLLLVGSYGALLALAGAARLHRMVGYLQLLAGLMAYGGLLLTSRFLGRSGLESASVPDSWWIVLLPPSWFVSYLELAAGTSNSTTMLRAALSIAAIVALVTALGGKLGIEYARHLSELPVAATNQSSPARTPLFPRGAARAVAILVVAHFRHDLRVRMGILAIVPLMAMYVIMGTGDGSFDPLALAVLLFPALLAQHFAASDAYHASWIYFSTPTDPAELTIALKNIAVVYFLLPFLLVVGAVFTWRLGDLQHAVVHTGILGVISHICLQGSVILQPRLPFALPPDKTRGSGSLLVWMVIVILGGQGALVVLDRWVYVSTWRTAGTMLLLTVLSAALNRVVSRRAHCCRQPTRSGR